MTPATLGSYAVAVETSPVETLTATGAVVGMLWGTLAGIIAAHFVEDSPGLWVAGAALVGGALVGAEGHRQGVELQQWLAQFPTPPAILVKR